MESVGMPGGIMQDRHCLELFSLSVDVEWCGLILPLCSRNFGTVVASAAHDEDIDCAEFAESIGLVCRISSQSSTTSGFTFNVGAVKVAGVVILLGLGGYLCYKFCKFWDLGYLRTNELTGAVSDSDSPQPPRPPSVTSPPSSALSSSRFILGIKGDPATKPHSFLNFQTKYFGPVNFNQDNQNNGAESSDAYQWDASDTTPSSESDGINTKDFTWPLTRENLSKHSYRSSRRNGYRHSSHNQFSPPEFNRAGLPRRRGWLLQKIQCLAIPDGNRSQHLIDLKEGHELDTNKLSPQECGCGTSTSTSSGSSPVCHPHFRHQSRTLSRDLSYDSLVLLSHSRHEGSIDSMSSDISLDLASLADQTSENSTVARMDKLQQEIDQLKTNCLMMDEDFETIRCNRNLPGLASLMESSEKCNEDESNAFKKESARACFKGLYSLTTINHSMSLDLSDSQPLSNDSNNEESPIHLKQTNIDLSNQIEEEPLPSLEWDEEVLDTVCEDEDKHWNMATSIISNQSNFDNNEKSLITDVSGYGSGEVNTTDVSGYGSGEVNNSSQIMTDSWASTVPSSCIENNNIHVPNHDTSLHQIKNINRSSSCESGRGMSETWSWSSSMSVSDLGTPSSASEHLPASHLDNIGGRIDILQYAESEWHGNTERASTIRKGYAEIVNTLNCKYIRQIRGDNYCAVRGTIYQTLAQGLPVPSGKQAMKNLSNALDSNSPWLGNWKFASRLPYTGNNVRRGMEICLQTLDNVASLMRSSNSTNKERENSLMTLLNTDPSLDVHILEAVKLHMMVQAMELHSMYIQGNDVPLFSMLLFARDTSESPVDLMNNHLHLVGDTGGLEQVEMFLLGYTLGVTIKVVRPSAFGTQDFTCYYPDWNVGVWPEVLLIAEDDRHYNVLIQ